MNFNIQHYSLFSIHKITRSQFVCDNSETEKYMVASSVTAHQYYDGLLRLIFFSYFNCFLVEVLYMNLVNVPYLWVRTKLGGRTLKL